MIWLLCSVLIFLDSGATAELSALGFESQSTAAVITTDAATCFSC
jgi:hypothetical protein